jgi:hypothetical protein
VPLPPDAAPTATALCGQPHTYKTRTGQTVSKPCIKAKNHTGVHSSRAQAERIDTSVITADALISEEAPTDELLDVLTERVRSEAQQKLDARVAEGHKVWLAGGKLTGFNDCIKAGVARRERCKPEHVKAVRKMIQNTEQVNPGVHVRIMPPKNHADGTKMLYWVAVDKKPATPRTPAAAAPAPAPAPAGGGRK